MIYLTEAEIGKLFCTIEKTAPGNRYWLRDLLMIKLGYYCGLRVSEVGMLSLSSLNINGDTPQVFVQRLKHSDNNTIKLSREVAIMLRKYIREEQIEDILFLSQHKKPISRKSLDIIFKKYCKLAKIPLEKSHWHSLRHSVGIHLVKLGLDVKELQSYLGHKNIASSNIYFQDTNKKRDGMYDKINKAGGLVR